MKYNGKLVIAVGLSAKSTIWKNQKMQWSDLVDRLYQEHRTTETFKEFIAATKDEQAKIKDVGGYVGGYLRNGRRKPENVVHRQILTLDIDFAHLDFWEDFCMSFNNAAVLHATHKHHESSPRFRLIMPLSREATPDEYVAVSRQIAGLMGIELFDNTTFETNRLMFWPSNPKDIDYYFKFQDGPWIDVDNLLSRYIDWKDSSLWPTAERQIHNVKSTIEKQENPKDKKGLIGAFCRTYSISEAIETFLNDLYYETTDNRYTYAKGTTASGLILYDDEFAYSHHGTDPCSGKLCNAFDLVRIHKFGHLDSDSEHGDKKKSFRAMEQFIIKDKRVKKIIAEENLTESKYDFAEALEIDEDQTDWMQDLEVDPKGKYLSSASNINMILANDARLKGLFRQNDFDGREYVFGSLPWRRIYAPEPVKNVDFAGVRNYIESIYGIVGSSKIEDALSLDIEKNSFHPVLEYLQGLTWDKTERVDTLLIDYFGAEDCVYAKEAIRKQLVGAVARIYRPGIKYDLVLVLVGKQGTGKSTFLKKLGRQWFSDSFTTVQGKEALEQIQGAWLIEMAELSGLRKAEVEAVKHFIAKQEDTFRPAYARTSETYKRQCVFFGTTNDKNFLRDPTGNRRFNPIDVRPEFTTKNIFDDLTEDEVNQIWAEAVHLYKQGEDLFMSDEAELTARNEQQTHSENDERKGIIEAFLNTLLPADWETKDLSERRMFLEDPLQPGNLEREVVCVAEIWAECLGKDLKDMDQYKTRGINDILRSMDDWEQIKSSRNFKIYGKQRYYARQSIQ